MKKTNPTFTVVLITVGVLLILGSVSLLAYSRLSGDAAAKRAAVLADELESLMPERTKGAWDDRIQMDMPAMEVDGGNFVGVLEAPRYDVRLPVGAEWDAAKTADYPCRYFGSVYDGSLIVGGSDHAAQLAFTDQAEIGDPVNVTDMDGRIYAYTVSFVERADAVSAVVLRSDEADLTLFMRDRYALDYVIVRCVLDV